MKKIGARYIEAAIVPSPAEIDQLLAVATRLLEDLKLSTVIYRRGISNSLLLSMKNLKLEGKLLTRNN